MTDRCPVTFRPGVTVTEDGTEWLETDDGLRWLDWKALSYHGGGVMSRRRKVENESASRLGVAVTTALTDRPLGSQEAGQSDRGSE